MNEIFSNDVTSSESNWKNTPQSLKDWKMHPRPSSKLFVSSKNHISKSANVSITISSYIMYIIFRVLRSTSPNFEPSIWDSFSSAVPTVPTFLLHYHDPCLGIKRHIQFFSRPSLASWQASQCGDTEDPRSHRGTLTTLRLCLRMIYFKRIIGKDLSLLHVSWRWRYDSKFLKLSTCAAHVTSKWINGWCFFLHVVV